MTFQETKLDWVAMDEITDLILSRATTPRQEQGKQHDHEVDDSPYAVSSETLDEERNRDPSVRNIAH